MSKEINNLNNFESRINCVTYTGCKHTPAHPENNEYRLQDIARGLSNTGRFAGQTTFFYSVAQHSVLVAAQMPTPELARIALLHDATEAYLGDIVRAVKKILPDYQELEYQYWRGIGKKFGLPTALPREVKEADDRMCSTEANQLILMKSSWDTDAIEAYPGLDIIPMPPLEAYIYFKRKAYELFPDDIWFTGKVVGF